MKQAGPCTRKSLSNYVRKTRTIILVEFSIRSVQDDDVDSGDESNRARSGATKRPRSPGSPQMSAGDELVFDSEEPSPKIVRTSDAPLTGTPQHPRPTAARSTVMPQSTPGVGIPELSVNDNSFIELIRTCQCPARIDDDKV